MDSRLPAHLEVAALIRLVEVRGGFATVLAKGEPDAGTILLLTTYHGNNATIYERMPQLDGTRPYQVSRSQDPEKPHEIEEYLTRRRRQDPDVWVIEADVADPEQFVASLAR